MKHKIGDIVTIRKDLKENNYYNGEYYIDKMNQYKGKTTKIIEERTIFSGRTRYWLIIDNQKYCWTDEMFEDKPQPIKKTIEHIISGNKTIVIIHNEDGSYKKGIALCSPEDKFDENVGFKLAYDRAMGIKEDTDNVKEKANKFNELQKFLLDNIKGDTYQTKIKDDNNNTLFICIDPINAHININIERLYELCDIALKTKHTNIYHNL